VQGELLGVTGFEIAGSCQFTPELRVVLAVQHRCCPTADGFVLVQGTDLEVAKPRVGCAPGSDVGLFQGVTPA
jgi:hypothetical protein